MLSKLIPQISEEELTPLVSRLLEIIQILIEENQHLKDEIARLKGQKPRLKIKPSNLAKEKDEDKTKKDNRCSEKKSKTKDIIIDEDIPLKPDNLPPGSVFIDYRDFIVQDIIFCPWNIRYRRGRWLLPSGEYIIAELPKDITGHYGSGLISFVLYQHYGCCRG